MKKTLLRYITLFIILGITQSSGFAQDYTRWQLPEGAKVRLGKGKVNDIQFSPDDILLAVATDIGIWIYDVQTGAEKKLIKVTPRGVQTVNCIAFSPDGKTLAVGNWVLGGAVELWNVNTGEHISTLKERIGSVKGLEFSPDGTMLACASWYRNVEYHMWEVESGREMNHFIGPQESLYNGLALSPDAHSVASASNGQVFLWDASTGNLQHTLNNIRAWTLAFSADSKTLVGGSTTLQVWDIESGKELSKLVGHKRNVGDITFSPNGKTFASGDTGGKIILWNFDTSKPKIDNGDKKRTLPNVLRSLSGNKKANIGNKHVNRTLMGHTLPVKALDFTSDSKRLASGSQDGTTKVWDVTTGDQMLTIQGHTGLVRALQFSTDGKTLFSGSSDGIIRKWDVETKTEQLIHTKPPWLAFTYAFSNDGKTVASGCWGEVRLWDTETESFFKPLKEHKGFVVTLAFSPDDKLVASGSWDGLVMLWDVPNRKLHTVLEGHTDEVSKVAFSPDGNSFASSSEDGTAHLWDLNTKKKTSLPIGENRGIETLVFSPDSTMLITASMNGLSIFGVKTPCFSLGM